MHDVPALAQDLSGISKELGAPIKALLGVNLLRHLNATFDFAGHQFVVRSFVAPAPARGDARSTSTTCAAAAWSCAARSAARRARAPRSWSTPRRPFPVALDDDGLEEGGRRRRHAQAHPRRPRAEAPRGHRPPPAPRRLRPPAACTALYGVPLADLEKATAVDLDGLVGAGLLYRYRCTFADDGRVLWIEDDPRRCRPCSAPAARAARRRPRPARRPPRPAGPGARRRRRPAGAAASTAREPPNGADRRRLPKK